MSQFFRFPHTPHIAWLGQGGPRDDKVLSPDEVADLLHGDVVLEEKLDGANLGFSAAPDGQLRAQNRGQYLEGLGGALPGQFARLKPWLAQHEDRLFDALGPDLIAFGEWCAARHSLDYATLPDWRQGRFWSTARRDAWARDTGLIVVPRLHLGHVTEADLRQAVAGRTSQFRPGPLEGVVVRHEDADWLQARGKLVRANFIQSIDSHWRSRALEWNQLDRNPMATSATPQET